MTKFPSPQDLLSRFSRIYPLQPATALWRAIEVAQVLRLGLGSGRGLDLGCGDGALMDLVLSFLSERPAMVGLDPEPAEIGVAASRGVYQATVVGTGSALPFESGAFDLVFSNSVLEHLADLDATIAECARVLRPGGRLVATVPQPAFRTMLRGALLPWADREAALARVDARLGHVNYLDAKEWQALLARHGLPLTVHRAYLDQRQVRRWEAFSRITGGVLQSLGADNRALYRLQRLTRADRGKAGRPFDLAAPPSLRDRIWSHIVAGRVLDPNPDLAGPHACLLILAEKGGHS